MKRSSLQDNHCADERNLPGNSKFFRHQVGPEKKKIKSPDLEKTFIEIKKELNEIDIGGNFHLGPYLFIEIAKIGENVIGIDPSQILKNDKIARLHSDIESLLRKKQVFEFIGNTIKTFPIRFFSGYYSHEEVFKTLSGIIFMLEFWKKAFNGNNLVQWEGETIDWWVSFCKNSRIDEPAKEKIKIISYIEPDILKKAIELKLCCFSV